MIIYAITQDYQAPAEYFANKVDALRALGEGIDYNLDHNYIIEIEVK